MTESPPQSSKVELHLHPTGDAPIMKNKKYLVDSEKRIEWIMSFIRRYLKLEETEQLFLYVNQAFAPSLDRTVSNLYECFGSDGKLIMYYSKSPAWG